MAPSSRFKASSNEVAMIPHRIASSAAPGPNAASESRQTRAGGPLSQRSVAVQATEAPGRFGANSREVRGPERATPAQTGPAARRTPTQPLGAGVGLGADVGLRQKPLGIGADQNHLAA